MPVWLNLLQPASIKHTFFKKNPIKLKSKLQKAACHNDIIYGKSQTMKTMHCLWSYTLVVKTPNLPKQFSWICDSLFPTKKTSKQIFVVIESLSLV